MPNFVLARAAVCGFLLVALGAGAAGGAQAQAEPGTSVVDLIAALRDQGTTIIYSSELVPDSLRVTEEPRARDLLAQLREVLAVHGLALQPGPRGGWLIVAAAPVAAAPPTPIGPSAALRPPAPTLDTVVVSASRYAFARATAPSERQIDRRQLEHAVTLGEDALRTTHSLPGMTSSGLTARVNVRGGETNETLVLLDGVRLFNPYHLKDFESLFGSISPRIIERIDVQTGGFPAAHGDRMSGVIAMQSLAPEEERHYEVGISTLTSSVLSSGRFAAGRGEWLTSLRRGNLDLLIDAANSDLGQPQYTDFFNKVGFALSDALAVTTGALILDDKISLADGDDSRAGADYDDRYLWVAIEHRPGSRLAARYLVSSSRLSSDRSGAVDDPDVAIGELRDRQDFDALGLDADWSLTFGARQHVEWGIALDKADASYDFASSRVLPIPIRVPELETTGDGTTAATLRLSDRQRAAYASYRAQPIRRLTTELGVRWDQRSHLDEAGFSPRLALLFDLSSRASLRASWGRFRQNQGINEVQVGDGLVEIFPAQEAEHSVLGFEYLFGDSMTLRAEAYRKEFERVRPRFENLYMRVSLLPELLPDRVQIAPGRAAARGVELSLESRADRWQWWLSFTRSSVEDAIPGRWADRSWHEPWSTKGGVIWTGAHWAASGSLTVRSGWPVTSLDLVGGELVAGSYNAQSFESFRSLDVRASRDLDLEGGNLEFFVELSNALNYENPCCIDYSVATDAAGAPVALTLDTGDWLPLIPALGFLWEF